MTQQSLSNHDYSPPEKQNYDISYHIQLYFNMTFQSLATEVATTLRALPALLTSYNQATNPMLNLQQSV